MSYEGISRSLGVNKHKVPTGGFVDRSLGCFAKQAIDIVLFDPRFSNGPTQSRRPIALQNTLP